MMNHAATELYALPEPMIFSPSRISAWLNCNRLAGWTYIAGYRSEGTASTELGKAVHALLETWTPHADSPELFDFSTKAGSIAASALMHLRSLAEAGGDPPQSEQHFFIEGDHAWQGYIDRLYSDRVLDFKTSSDPNKWAKTPQQLLSDPQALVYAHYFFSQHLTVPSVVLDWLYLSTRTPYRAKSVQVEMTREHAAQGFEILEEAASEFQAAVDAAPLPGDVEKTHKYILSLDPNYSACDDYGGCPNKSRCHGLNFFNIPNSPPRTGKTMNTLERLKLLSNPSAAAPAAVAAPAAASPTPPPVQAPYVASARTDIPANDAPSSPPAINPPSVKSRIRRTHAQMLADGDVPKALLGKMPELLQPPSHVPQFTNFTPPPATDPTDPPPPITVTDVPAPRPPSIIPPPPLPATFPAGTAIGTLYIGPPAPASVPPPPPAPAAPAPGAIVGTLYVGCAPLGSPSAQTFDFLLAEARQLIGSAAYFSDYGYKTNGRMLEAVTKLVSAKRWDTLVVDPRTPEAILCLSYLRSVSSVCVESFCR